LGEFSGAFGLYRSDLSVSMSVEALLPLVATFAGYFISLKLAMLFVPFIMLLESQLKGQYR
jgi:hypothetical protein